MTYNSQYEYEKDIAETVTDLIETLQRENSCIEKDSLQELASDKVFELADASCIYHATNADILRFSRNADVGDEYVDGSQNQTLLQLQDSYAYFAYAADLEAEIADQIENLEKIRTVTISSMFSWFSIGTYGSYFELDDDGQDSSQEIEYLIEEGQLPDSFNDLDWREQEKIGQIEYDHAGYLDALVDASVDYVQDMVSGADRYQTGFQGLISEVQLVDGSIRSPREYNFSTDSYDIEITFNPNLVEEYIETNRETYDKYVEETWTSYDGFWSHIGADDDETKLYFVLQQIAKSEYDEPDYAHAMTVLDTVNGNGRYFWFQFTPEYAAQLEKKEIAAADKANELQLFDETK
jgi:hypothetical protein